MPKNEPCVEAMDDRMVEILRSKTPAEKIAMISATQRTARMLAAGGVRYQHPDWSEEKVQAEVWRRVTGGTR